MSRGESVEPMFGIAERAGERSLMSSGFNLTCVRSGIRTSTTFRGMIGLPVAFTIFTQANDIRVFREPCHAVVEPIREFLVHGEAVFDRIALELVLEKEISRAVLLG